MGSAAEVGVYERARQGSGADAGAADSGDCASPQAAASVHAGRGGRVPAHLATCACTWVAIRPSTAGLHMHACDAARSMHMS